MANQEAGDAQKTAPQVVAPDRDLDTLLRSERRRMSGFYCIIKRTHCPTVRNHNWNVEHKRASPHRVALWTTSIGAQVCTCQHVCQCSRVPKEKENKRRTDALPS